MICKLCNHQWYNSYIDLICLKCATLLSYTYRKNIPEIFELIYTEEFQNLSKDLVLNDSCL